MIDFVNETTEDIARELLGKLLIHQTPDGIYSGYIVETEAYVGVEDMACHTYEGKRTPKVESMYQTGGTIYIYTMHTHTMLNIVTKEKGDPQAVLIRAVEPADGIERMETNRNVTGVSLSNGPGKLTKAMAITKELNGKAINESALLIDDSLAKTPANIAVSARVGIPNKGDWTSKPLRFYIEGHPYVSGMRKRDCKYLTDCWL
jgi:DNA-3-methyladenine glycosylase